MADNFGLKIGVEGEKEFKNSLREINQSFKVLGSEMKLVSSEFDKNDKDGFFAKVYSAFSAGLSISCSGLILVNIPLSKILFAKDFFAYILYHKI